MEAELQILREQTTIFLILLLIGYVFYKIRLVNDTVVNSIPPLVLRLILPSMLLARLPLSGTRDEVLSMGWVLLGIIIMFGIHMLLAFLIGKIMRLKQPTMNVHLCVCALPNSAFVGYPLLFEIFPNETLFMAPYMLVDAFMLFVIAPILLNPGKDGGFKLDPRVFLTPANFCLVIGVIMLMTGLKLPPVLQTTCSELGSMSKGLGLFFIGAQIGRLGILHLIKRWQLYVMCVVKLVIAPVIIFYVLRLIGPLDYRYMVMISIMSMLPSMLTICMQAQDYGTDPDYAFGGLLLTTVIGMITMPVILSWLVQ